MTLPKTITKNIYILKCPHTGDLNMCLGDMADYGYITLSVQEVTLDIPQDVDVVPLKVAALKEQQRQLILGTDNKINEIEGSINKLLNLKN